VLDEKYVFGIRQAATSDKGSNILPKDWWLRGARGPLAILEASKDGLRIIQRSRRGAIAQVVVGVGVGLTVILGVFIPTAFLIVGGLGESATSVLLWTVVAPILAMGIALWLSPHVRKLAAWNPEGPFTRIHVRSVAIGVFHHELTIQGEGHEVRVQANARLSTITAALRLANEMPLESSSPG